jgi:rhamnosyl/mannosyltransferase
MSSGKLKVLQVGKYYPPARGGMESHLELLCQGLKDFVDLEVVVAQEGRSSETEIVQGVTVQRLGTAVKMAGAPFCPALFRVMKNTRADIIHIHAPHPTALLTYIASGCSSRLVCSYHSDIIRQRILGRLIGPLQERAFRRAAAIIVSSARLIEFSPVLAHYRDRCRVVPFGIDETLYQLPAGAEVEALRKRFAPPIVLAVGRLVYYKGFEYLIRAVKQVEAPMSLLIIGEGPLRASLQKMISDLGLEGRVHLLGNVENAISYYQACDLFVLPSVARSEAFGIVQLEAMACGKAVINTWLDSGVPDVSLHEQTGLTVPFQDAASLAAAISRLLHDDDLRHQFGAAGKKRISDTFSASQMVKRTLDIYARIAPPGLQAEPLS